MKIKLIQLCKREAYKFVSLFLGLAIFGSGIYITTNESAQVYDYNQGLTNMTTGNIGKAKIYFKRSIAIYEANQAKGNLVTRILAPVNGKEIAALAYFQLGNTYTADAFLNRAVKAYETSLALNPGNDYQGLSILFSHRQHNEALNTKYNLEMLFAQNPGLQKKQGEKKTSSNSQGKPGNIQKPMPGHGMHHGNMPPQNSNGI